MNRAAAVVACALGACTDDRGPRLESVSPAAAGRNAQVALRGRRFCADHVDCAGVTAYVQLGLAEPIVRANIVGYTDSLATFVVPGVAVPGEIEIVLIVDGFSSNALAFEVLP